MPAAALLMTVHQGAASVIQPVLGHMADRSTTRIFSFAGTAAMAIGISLLGVALHPVDIFAPWPAVIGHAHGTWRDMVYALSLPIP